MAPHKIQLWGPRKGAEKSYQIDKIIRQGVQIPCLIWSFTENDLATFVMPNTAFGVLGAFAPTLHTAYSQAPPSPQAILSHVPLVLVFNWYNVLVFTLANQRSPESVREDIANKPWRPIPSGKATSEQIRWALLATIPISMVLNYYLGVWEQGCFIPILSYLYNDLGGGDELIRDLIICIAYAVANSASLEIAIGDTAQTHISHHGWVWTATISGVILTTMQVQDLKDQAGDRIRGRRTIPLYFGDEASRVTIAVFVCMWSMICPCLWEADVWAFALPVPLAAMVVTRVLWKRNVAEDATTWKWWCVWTVSLYMLPAMSAIRR